MANERSTSVGSSSAPSSALEEITRLASDEDVTARKQCHSERDATKIYLLSLKTDKELAAMLVDERMAPKERHSR